MSWVCVALALPWDLRGCGLAARDTPFLPALRETDGPRTLMKRALITGITGQDGAYLTELLLSKG